MVDQYCQLLVWKNVLSLLKPQPSNEKSFSFLVLDLFFSDVKKVEFLPFKVFFCKSPIRVRFQLFFLSTKVWTFKSKNLVLYGYLTKFDTSCTVQHLASTLKLCKLIFLFQPLLRNAVEISDQKILIFQKFGISTFTEKKNQVFWTRIDY